MRKTLAFRIITLSIIWVIISLVITGLLLVQIHREHTASHYDAHVSMHLEELTGASHFAPDGTFQLAFFPSDPRYQVEGSGWYWEVQQSGETLMRSPSLSKYSLDLGNLKSTTTVTVSEIVGPYEGILRLHVITIQIDPEQQPLVFLATAPLTGILHDVAHYYEHILQTFLALGVGLLLAVVIQVRVALKPLKAISQSISDIRAGKSTKLPDEELEDVRPLVDELNFLLDHNAVLVKRARNQLGDLAHSVKNPLAVITNEARSLPPEQRNLIIGQTSEISKNIDHYLSRARTFGNEKVLGSRSSIRTVTDDLVYAMQRIYQENELEFDLSRLKSCWFKGEAQDLEEMMGNLIDNACKWAKSQVRVTCGTTHGNLAVVVEDDGPGIPEAEFENVMRRGNKLDPSIPGHGQGMGIVNDIAALYSGALELGRSELGGLRATLILPAATTSDPT